MNQQLQLLDDFDPPQRAQRRDIRAPRPDSEWALLAVRTTVDRCVNNAAQNLARLAMELQARARSGE